VVISSASQELVTYDMQHNANCSVHFVNRKRSDDWRLIYFAALNEALKQELERLKLATGEVTNSDETYNMRFQHVPYNSSFFPLSRQNTAQHQGGAQLPSPFHPPHSNMPNNQMLSHPNTLQHIMQQDSIGRFQGLDIGKGPLVVKSENSSISASESSSTF
jgi:hypothetical protein